MREAPALLALVTIPPPIQPVRSPSSLSLILSPLYRHFPFSLFRALSLSSLLCRLARSLDLAALQEILYARTHSNAIHLYAHTSAALYIHVYIYEYVLRSTWSCTYTHTLGIFQRGRSCRRLRLCAGVRERKNASREY